jgi:hypothetical protein
MISLKKDEVFAPSVLVVSIFMHASINSVVFPAKEHRSLVGAKRAGKSLGYTTRELAYPMKMVSAAL